MRGTCFDTLALQPSSRRVAKHVKALMGLGFEAFLAKIGGRRLIVLAVVVAAEAGAAAVA